MEQWADMHEVSQEIGEMKTMTWVEVFGGGWKR
jgi:hypothetical protein